MKTSGRIVLTILAATSLAACTTKAGGPDGDAELGIARFQLTEDASHLVIVGLDDQDKQVAKVSVQRGHYAMSQPWADDRVGDELNVDGRQLSLQYGSDPEVQQESAGYTFLRLPWPPKTPATTRLLAQDPQVAFALARWAISFRQDEIALGPDGELALQSNSEKACGGTCSGSKCATTVNGAGVDCKQAFGGTSVNTCATHGSTSTGCATVGDPTSSYSQQTYLFQCCSSGGTYAAAEKTCQPGTGASSDCGTGGSTGCAVCTASTFSYSYSDTCGVSATQSNSSCTNSDNSINMSWESCGSPGGGGACCTALYCNSNTPAVFDSTSDLNNYCSASNACKGYPSSGETCYPYASSATYAAACYSGSGPSSYCSSFTDSDGTTIYHSCF